jgi:hypothetical protein
MAMGSRTPEGKNQADESRADELKQKSWSKAIFFTFFVFNSSALDSSA